MSTSDQVDFWSRLTLVVEQDSAVIQNIPVLDGLGQESVTVVPKLKGTHHANVDHDILTNWILNDLGE